MADEQKPPIWWQTLPGILTATAAIITAVSGLLVVLFQQGVIGRKNEVAPSSRTEAHSPSAQRSNSTAADSNTRPGGALKTWAESEAVITTTDGAVTTLRAETLSNCISVDHEFTLSSGQVVAFEKMRSFEVLRADPLDAPNARAALLVTLLDGKTIKDSVGAGCDIFGYNDLGRFSTYFQNVKRVDFRR